MSKLSGISKEELIKLYEEQNISDQKIAQQFKCSDVAISYLRKSFGIKTKSQFKRILDKLPNNNGNIEDISNEEFKKLYYSNTLEKLSKLFFCSTLKIKNEIKRRDITLKTVQRIKNLPELTPSQKNIIFGSLLGDGHIAQSSSLHAFYKESHSVNQDLYAKYLYTKLKPFSIKISITKNPDKGRDEIGFKTTSTDYFKKLRDIYYPDGVKEIPLEFLKNNWNSEILAYWYFGDGELKDNSPRICTAFKNNLDEFISFINDKENLDIEKIIYPSMPKMSFLKIKNKRRLFDIIKQVLTPDMIYKVPKECYDEISPDLIKEYNVRAFDGFYDDIHKYKTRQYNVLDDAAKQKWEKDVFDYYRKYGFPYIKMSEEKLNQKISELKKVVIEENNKTLQFKTQGLNICKNFMNHIYEARIKEKNKSPIELWEDDLELKKLIRNRFLYSSGVSPASMRTGVDLNFKTVANFKPTVSKFICETFGKNKILYLPDAGYGGKLLGGLISGVKEIICLDPNIKNINSSISLASRVSPEKKVIFVKNCSEDYLPENYFNKVGLVLSCPPYFDKEIYEKDNHDQSISRYTSYSLWLTSFLQKSINNFYNLLESEGIYALVIEKKMISDILKCCYSKFGLIDFYKIPTGRVFDKSSNIHKFVYETLLIFQKDSDNLINIEDVEALKTVYSKNKKRNFLKLDYNSCVEKIKEIYKLGYKTNRAFLNEHPELFPYSTSTVEKYFGTWNDFLKVAEIPINLKYQTAIEKMINYRKICLTHGKFLSFYELEKIEGIPATQYKRLFNKNEPYAHLKEELPKYLLEKDESIFNAWLYSNFSEDCC